MKYSIIFIFVSCMFLNVGGFIGAIVSAVAGIGSLISGVTSGIQATQGLVGAIRGPPQQTVDPGIFDAIAEQQKENRDQFEKVFDGIYGIGKQLGNQQQENNISFERVFTKLGTLEENIEAGREESRQNFIKISEHIGQLGDQIDNNQKEVLLNFATVFDKFRFLGSHLEVIDEKIQRTFDVVGSQRQVDEYLVPNIIEMNNKLGRFKEHTEAMHILFGYFMQYSSDVMAFDNDTLMNFVSATLSHSDSSPMILSQKMLANAVGILQDFGQDGIEDYLVCIKQKSPQQVLYELYSMVIFAELKGLITSTFARDLKLYFGGGTFSKERMTELQKSITRMKDFTTTVQRVIGHLGRHLRSCDSPSNKMGTHYFQFNDFINSPNVNTGRYISLDTVESDIANKRVVTGLKLTEHFGEIHMQIQEAQMGPLATINGSSAYWVPVDRHTSRTKLTLRKDHARMDIDVFTGLTGHVVTGVRFREIGDGVTLETRVSPFDPMTGSLDHSKSVWLNNMNTPNKRQQINLDKVNSPFDATVTPLVQSTSNEYLYFTSSTQTGRNAKPVVPFFDTRRLAPSTLVPLSGIGLLYKSASHRFGGYLAPIVVCLDYSEFTKVDIDSPKVDTKRWDIIAPLPKTPAFNPVQVHQTFLNVRSVEKSNGLQVSSSLLITAFSIVSTYLFY